MASKAVEVVRQRRLERGNVEVTVLRLATLRARPCAPPPADCAALPDLLH